MPEQTPEPEEQHPGDPAAEQDGRDEGRTSEVDEMTLTCDVSKNPPVASEAAIRRANDTPRRVTIATCCFPKGLVRPSCW